ncbi:hypothetical protein RAS1_34990 [Phycisphaerae bacterium RAS1]|nr:hypothetical protein RAS1_34990 [Phycisphaerae bacterium RAS1]
MGNFRPESVRSATIRPAALVLLTLLTVLALGLPLWILTLDAPVATGAPAEEPGGEHRGSTPTSQPTGIHADARQRARVAATATAGDPREPQSAPTPVTWGELAQVVRRPAPLPAPTTESQPTTRPATNAADIRAERLRRFGGTAETENAVEAGLAWLAAHQARDGTWDAVTFQRQCPDQDRCGGPAQRRLDDSISPGLTGLCLLAFVGAGYTDQYGPYPQVVTRAVDALLRIQNDRGGFSRTPGMAGYNDSVATFALAEYQVLVRDERLAEPLRKAAANLAATQQALGGWDYLPTPETGRNDTSITAWMVQALSACAAAEIPASRQPLVRSALHFMRAAETDGRVWYADNGEGFRVDPGLRPAFRYGPAMTACGLVCEELLGWERAAPIRERQIGSLLTQLPSTVHYRGRDRTQLHSEYYWYYGTLAMFQAGGERWERWNARLRDTLLPLQDRRKEGSRKLHSFGSWQPYGENWGKWGRMGGRVYTTAICTLTLEIYYRHTPAYLETRELLRAEDWLDFLAPRTIDERRDAVEALSQMRLELGEPVLVALLEDPSPTVALKAAQALAELDSPLGGPVIEKHITVLPPWGRAAAERALSRTREIRRLPPAEGELRLFDAGARLATLRMTRAHVGMQVGVATDSGGPLRMRVVRRFSGRDVVLAEVVGEWNGEAPRVHARAAEILP